MYGLPEFVILGAGVGLQRQCGSLQARALTRGCLCFSPHARQGGRQALQTRQRRQEVWEEGNIHANTRVRQTRVAEEHTHTTSHHTLTQTHTVQTRGEGGRSTRLHMSQRAQVAPHARNGALQLLQLVTHSGTLLEACRMWGSTREGGVRREGAEEMVRAPDAARARSPSSSGALVDKNCDACLQYLARSRREAARGPTASLANSDGGKHTLTRPSPGAAAPPTPRPTLTDEARFHLCDGVCGGGTGARCKRAQGRPCDRAHLAAQPTWSGPPPPGRTGPRSM